jgi:TRAP-type C4-dicarboxylate transport system permease small subunit
LLFIAFLGTAWLLRREGHVKMDILVNRLQPRAQAFLGIFSSVIGAVVCLVLVWYGVQVTWDHWLRGTYKATTMEIPNAPILVIIPLGSFMFFIQCLRRAHGYYRHWRVQ